MAGRHRCRPAISVSGRLGLRASALARAMVRRPFQPRFFDVRVPRGRSTCVLPDIEREDDMADSVYKVIELIGTSKDSWEKAAAVAVNRASKSLRDLRVAEVVKLDLVLDAKGKIEAYRAKLNVSFKFEGS
jgi:flavin-binding protein dodecin